MFPSLGLRKYLFIDLEETLITNWYDSHLGKKQKVETLLCEHFPGYPNGKKIFAAVWSFAITNDKDRDRFRSEMMNWLSDNYHLHFTEIITTEEIEKCTKEFTSLLFETWHEISQIYGKDGTLEHWVRSNPWRDSEIILLDDTVENKRISFYDTNTHITYVKV